MGWVGGGEVEGEPWLGLRRPHRRSSFWTREVARTDLCMCGALWLGVISVGTGGGERCEARSRRQAALFRVGYS